MSRQSRFPTFLAATQSTLSVGRRSRLPLAVRGRRLSLERLEDRALLHGAPQDLSDLLADQEDQASHGHEHSALVAPASLHRNTQTHYIGGAPFEFTWDPAPAEGSAGSGQPLAGAEAAALNPLSSIPVLNSLPGAAASLYLDFDGHFESNWGSYSNITTPVFDQDNDPTTFSDGELAAMQTVWQIVAEDYAPFNINVTTVEPANFANGVAMRVAIGGDGAWSGGQYGGIAYVGSFTNSLANTVYVFPDNLGTRATGEASSHEAGHSFGLQHQSEYDASGNLVNEYYGGPGDGRAPIMGVSYYATRGVWWYGTTISPNTYQDDMSVLSNATNGFGFRADDHSAAAPLAVGGRDVSGAGNIERSTDQDSFSFTAAAGELNLNVSVPEANVGNLNARLELGDTLGNLLAASDPATFATLRTITYAAAGGDYVLVVASHGTYGDLGQYTISGTIPVPSTINTPINLEAAAASVSQIDLSWIDNADNEQGYIVDRSANGGLTWTQRATLPADSASFSDTAAAGKTYYYRVSAFNAIDVSSYSNQASATTLPAAPNLLTATALWSDQISLKWINVAGETGYKIERSSDGGSSWNQIAALGIDAASYLDTGLSAQSTYAYRVRATNAGGDSGYSNLASATTLAVAPTAFGTGDGAYIVESWSGAYNDLLILPGDQKILAAGSKYAATGSDHRMVIGRYAASGSIDTTYGSGGITAPAFLSSIEYGYALALQPDGKAVVAGLAASGHAVARFNANGSIDTSFGSSGLATVNVSPDDFFSPAQAIGLQSTGKIVIAGVITDTNTDTAPAVLARFTAGGAVDTGKNGFGPVVQGKAPGYILPNFGGSSNAFNDLVIQSGDKIVVVGNSGAGGLLLARYTTNGALDSTFNGSGFTVLLPAELSFNRGFGITLQPDGKIVIAGNCSGIDGANDMLVARYNANGTLDVTFGGGNGYVRLDVDGLSSLTAESATEVAIQPDGKIVVAGTLSIGSDPSKVLIARLNVNGTLDSAFGTGGFKVGSLPTEMGSPGLNASAVALMADGSIVVSGYSIWAPAGTSGLPYYHPLLMRFYGAAPPPPAAVVTPTTGLVTTEAGGQAAFTVSLDTQPTADVIIAVSSSDLTEGTTSVSSLTFTAANWNVPQSVTITGVDDAITDGDLPYTIALGAVSSADPRYAGLDPADVSVTNIDNDIPATKFYVVDDGSANRTYEYGAGGESVENYALNSGNSTPRGAASTAAGDKVWVIDVNKSVYVYDANGALLGSWSTGGLAGNATVEGIATNGTDVWIVDARSDKVFRYTGAASRLSGSQSAASSFSLNSGNIEPRDIVTDGSSLWVVNDSTADKVFKYTVAGTLLGSWTISTSGASSPTGITIDPTNVSAIWIADAGTDRVYQYNNAASRTSGSQAADASFALAAGNTNPQGIADPPSPALIDAVLAEATSDHDLAIDAVPAGRPSADDHDAALLSIVAEFDQAWSRPKRKEAISQE